MPEAGQIFKAVPDERTARAIVTKREEEMGAKTVAPARAFTLDDFSMRIQAGQAKELNLIVKTEMTLTLPQGVIPFEVYPGDYKKVDGILLPHKVRQVIAGLQELLVVVESIEHNVTMPEGIFQLPEEVQALIEKEKAAAADKDESADKAKSDDD